METPHPLNAANHPAATPTTLPVIRTPDQRVRVFVSSTLDELAPERAAAREAITQLRLTPVLFESGARPYPPRELYRAYLAQSDIFIGLYWQRYGWVAPDMAVSGLEDEYQLSADKPRLIYLKTPAPAREPGLQRLLDCVRSEEVASYQKFSTAEELRERIANDLAQLLTEHFMSPAETPVVVQLAPLPEPRSRLIDREQELARARALLEREDVGLVTLIGPGGVGKTRLALEVAAHLAPQFADGVAFISLASLKDPQLLVPTIARTLGLSETGYGAVNEQLVDYLRPRQLLLVLDNAEQLVATAAPLATQALELARRLKLLVTSREPLRVRGERLVPVAPLMLPDPAQLPDLEDLLQVPAVALFVERAQEARPDFTLTTENAAAIAEICQRLDGLPLALELAAARSAMLSPAALLNRLEQRQPLLSRGARDLPERQQTLRNTIAWSYELLEAGEQQLFRRLAVFAGGFTLEAVQSICLPGTTTPSSSELVDDGVALEQLAQLLDKSLVQAQQNTRGEPRFSMLGTIHEYAQEQLRESREEDTVQQQHAHYFLRLAEEAEPHLFKPAERESWLERLDQEEGNLRVALAWCRASQNNIETGLPLAGALSMYWYLRGYLLEGRAVLEAMLARTASSDRSMARGKALWGTGLLAWVEGDFAAASCLEEALSLWRELGDRRWIAYTDVILAQFLGSQGSIAAARSAGEESLSLFKDLGDVWGEAMVHWGLGGIAHRSGDLDATRTHYEESVRLFSQQEDALYASLVLSSWEALARDQGDEELARSLHQQSLPLIQQVSHQGAYGLFLIRNGEISLHQYGYEQQAKMLYLEGLRLWQDLKRVEQGIGIIEALAGLAEIAAAQGQAERAGRLFGAAATLLPSNSFYRDGLNSRITAARAYLDAETFEAGWSEGQAMTEKQAISFALQEA